MTVDGLRAVKPMREWQLSDNAAYMHYCPNETIDGIAIDETPDFGKDVVVAADFSSTILSRPIDVSRYGVIYAGAQKNIGPAGLTIVIVREDLLGKANIACPRFWIIPSSTITAPCLTRRRHLPGIYLVWSLNG